MVAVRQRFELCTVFNEFEEANQKESPHFGSKVSVANEAPIGGEWSIYRRYLRPILKASSLISNLTKEPPTDNMKKCRLASVSAKMAKQAAYPNIKSVQMKQMRDCII